MLIVEMICGKERVKFKKDDKSFILSILEVIIINNLRKGLDWYYNKMVELIKKDDKYSQDESLLLIQDCEDYFSIERSEGYTQRVCSCGVKDEIRYSGTKSEILREIEIELLEHKYGDSD